MDVDTENSQWFRALQKLIEAAASRNLCKQVQIAEVGSKCEVQAVSHGSDIERERQSARYVSKIRLMGSKTVNDAFLSSLRCGGRRHRHQQ